MAYEEPGVKVIQQLVLAAANIQEGAQVTTIVGPLYEVFEDLAHSQRYDPVTGGLDQTFLWEGKKAFSVVDLFGTREDTSEPDSQILEFAPFPATWKLRDPSSSQTFDVDPLTDVFDVGQSGFSIVEGSGAATARSSGAVASAAQYNRLHLRAGGLVTAGITVGDRIRLTNGTFDVRGSVTGFADDDVTYQMDKGAFTVDAATPAASATIVANLVDTPAPTPEIIPAAGFAMVDTGASLERFEYSFFSRVGDQYTFTLVGTTNVAHAAGAAVTVLVQDDVNATASDVDGDMLTTPGNLISSAANFTGTEGARLKMWVEKTEVDDGVSDGATPLITTSSLAITSAEVGNKVTVHTDDLGSGAATNTDGDLDSVSGKLTSAGASFTNADVGKVIKIGSAYRRVTAVDSGNVLVYSGTALAGPSVTYIVYGPLVRTIEAVAANGTDFYVDAIVPIATGTGLPVVIHRPVIRDVATVESATEVTYSGSAISSDTGFLLYVPFDLFDEDLTYELFPDYEVLMTYRALDIANVDDTLTVFSASDLTVIGNVTKDNPLLWAAQTALLAMGTDDTPLFLQPVDLWPNELAGSKSGLPQDVDETLGFLNSLETLSSNDSVYYMVPLTRNSAVRDAFVSHCDALSVPEQKKERICFLSYALPLGEFESVSGQIAAGLDRGNKKILETGAGFVTVEGITPGDQVTVQAPARWAGDYIVGSGSTDDELVLLGDNWGQDDSNVYDATVLEFTATDGDTTVSGEVDSATANVWKDVEIGDYLYDEAADVTRLITGVVTGTGGVFTKLEYAGTDLPSGTGRTVHIIRSDVSVSYYVDPLDNQEQADALEAIGQARGNRRVVHVWPDQAEQITGTDDFGAEVREFLPSYFLASGEAGRLSVIPVERASTGLELAGFTSLVNSNKKFNTSQLNTIAGGGWTVFTQRTDGAPIEVRHLLTTDLSTVKTQEVSFTKNVDNMAKVKRSSVEPLLNDDKGRINITKDFLTALAVPFQGIFENFVSNEQLVRTEDAPPYKILSIRQDPTQPDTILEDVELNVPLPANKVTVTFII